MRFIIGVDGGGTKTVVVLSDLRGNIVTSAKGGPFEYAGSDLIRDRLKNFLIPLIEKVVSSAKVNIHDCMAVCMGVTGVDSVEESREMVSVFRELWANVMVRVENDVVIAFYAATGGDPGVVLISGTGSVGYGENSNGNKVRLGGLGPVIGDEGSGYDIGRKGIVAGIQSEDGRGEKSSLEELIKEAYGLKEVRDIQFLVYKTKHNREMIASVAPIVINAADLGDRAAIEILNDAGIELSKIAIATVRALRIKNCMVYMAGSILKKSDIVFKSFRSKVLEEIPGARVSFSEREPVYGAVILAIKDLIGDVYRQ